MLLKGGQLFAGLESAASNPQAYQPAAATLLLTAVFDRTAWKYKERAYRYVLMDAGHVAFQLALVSASLGMAAPLTARFDDGRINQLLGLDSGKEAALLLMPLGRALQEEQEWAPLPEPGFGTRPISPGEQTELFALVHHGTGLARDGSWEERPPGRPDRGRPQEGAQGPGSAARPGKEHLLPRPVQGRELYPAIRARRSRREYQAGDLGQDELAALCLAAVGRGPRQVPFFGISPRLGLRVVVRAAKGLAPGVYLYHPEQGSLSLEKEGDLSTSLAAACLHQDACREAAALFAISLPWDELDHGDGDRGYRYTCILAGLVGGGLYLQASSLGLGVCGIGAFEDQAVSTAVGVDPDKEAVLYLVAVGR